MIAATATKPPPRQHRSSPYRVRSLFISDLHLGSKFARIDELIDFLEHQQPEYLYLVGDIVDGWCLKRKWHWPENYTRLLHRLMELAKNGTSIRFTPGNHDEFLRRFLMNNELVCIHNEFQHVGADGRRFVVLHGDQFDDIETHARWLSVVGNLGYELILRIDFYTNAMLTKLGRRRRPISQTLKSRVKRVVQFVSGFQSRATQHARELDCQAVVCGHIHVPEATYRDDVLYLNLGDWVENRTALIEYGCGRLELIKVSQSEPIAVIDPLPSHSPAILHANSDCHHVATASWQPAVA